MKYVCRMSVVLFFYALLFLPVSGFSQNDTLEMTFQTMYAGDHILNRALYAPGCQEIAVESNGQLTFQYFTSGEMVKSEDTLPALMNGLLDMGGVGPQYQPTLFPYTMTFTVPYITEDSVQASALYWRAYSTLPEVRAEWDKLIKVLTVWGSDRSGLFSTVGPIMSPEDIKGKKVLIWSGGQVPQVRAWGGVPIQVSPNDTYTTLKRGVGDVFFGPLPTGVAYKLMEVSPDITVIPATTLFLVNGVNWDVWESLTTEQQSWLEAKFGGEAASIRSGQLLYEATNEDLKTMEKAGCAIHYLTEAQLKAFQDEDSVVTLSFWLNDLRRLGNHDPVEDIRRAYRMAAETPTAQ